jgi:hypothetical protein
MSKLDLQNIPYQIFPKPYNSQPKSDRFIPSKIEPNLFALLQSGAEKVVKPDEISLEDGDETLLNQNLVENQKLHNFNLLLERQIIKHSFGNSARRNTRRLFSFQQSCRPLLDEELDLSSARSH